MEKIGQALGKKKAECDLAIGNAQALTIQLDHKDREVAKIHEQTNQAMELKNKQVAQLQCALDMSKERINQSGALKDTWMILWSELPLTLLGKMKFRG